MILKEDQYVMLQCHLLKIHKKETPLRPKMNCIAPPTYNLVKYLAGLLSHLLENPNNMQKFTGICPDSTINHCTKYRYFGKFWYGPSADKSSTGGHTTGTPQNFHKQTVNHMIHALTTTYCLYNGSFYEQKDVVALGSPPPDPSSGKPLYSKLQKASHKNSNINSLVQVHDNTFILWLHRKEKLQDFLRHLNGIHHNIKFAMAIKKNGALPFLDILVTRRLDGSLGHGVYRKPTHSDLYPMPSLSINWHRNML
jgi:hypothetical protein